MRTAATHKCYGRFAVATGERPPSSRERPLGVGDVVRLAGRVLDGLGLVWLEGEVTQVSQPASGHLYFALRDREAVLSAVMWSREAQRMRFRIEPGQRLRVRGRLGVYDRDGKMQLYADFAEPAGQGALQRKRLRHDIYLSIGSERWLAGSLDRRFFRK